MRRIKLQLVVIGGSLAGSMVAPAQTWTTTEVAGNCVSVASSADGKRLAAVGSWGIFTSTNQGSSWIQQAAPPVYSWYSVASSADGIKLAAGPEGGPVYTSVDGGVTWSPTLTPATWWTSITCSADGSTLVAAAGYPLTGYLYSSTDSGNTWSSNSPYLAWNGVASSADGSKLAAVDVIGDVCTSTNSGATWESQFGQYGWFWAGIASSADGTKLVAALGGGGIYRSTNAGVSWAPTQAPNIYWSGVASSEDGTQLIATSYATNDMTDYGPIYTSTNSGASWVSNYMTGYDAWASVAMSADGHAMAATQYGGWVYTTQTAPAPRLNLLASPGNVDISWLIPSVPLALQQSPDLLSWTKVTNLPALNLTNLQDCISLAASNTAGFFRLAAP